MLQKNTKTSKGFAAALAILLPLLFHFEGVRYKAYRDIAGVLTICVGETHNVHVGQTATVEECKDMTTLEAMASLWKVKEIVKGDLPPERWAALADFEYNVGPTAFRNSSIVRDLNDTWPGPEYRIPNACNALLMYNKVRVHGVLKVSNWQNLRRQKERQLCLLSPS